MKNNKESLIKLIKLVEELSKTIGNEWFKTELLSKLANGGSPNLTLSQIDEIYEYCLNKILSEHADKFYSDFKLLDSKAKLIEDFIRMEKFRREDNFEDFCLAAYQQLESIINKLIITPDFINYFIENKDLPAVSKYDYETKNFVRKGNQTVGKLIFLTSDQDKITKSLNVEINSWYFNQKFRAVLYYYYFNKEIRNNTELFDKMYEIGNCLYQGRNLNHRGSVLNPIQKAIVDNLLPNQHKYYFKFLGFLEDFITTINKNI